MSELKYYDVKVKVTYDDDNGRTRKRSEKILVKSSGMTEVEAETVKYFSELYHEFSIKGISETTYVDVIDNDE